MNNSKGSVSTHEVQLPIIKDDLLEFNPALKWMDLKWLREFAPTVNPVVTKRLWDQLAEYLSCWDFNLETDYDLVTGMIFVTPIQGILRFRPHVWVTGATNTGKTALFTFLGRLWPYALRLENETSEAAIRQEIRHSCLPVLYDEFEAWYGRDRVIKLLRTSTRGGYVIKGTPNQKPIKYGLRHIFWLASVDVGLQREADRNRFIIIELQESNTIEVPDSLLLNQLGQELVGASVALADRIDALYQKLVSSADIRQHGRFGESLALPAVVKAVLLDRGIMGAKEFFNEFKEDRKDLLNEMAEPDYAELIAYICSSTIWAETDYGDSPTRKSCQIGDLIQQGKGLEELSQHGIRILDDKKIYLCPNLIQRYLLKDVRWKDTNVGDIIKRIPGAEQGRLRVGGCNLRGYTIPRFRLNLDDGQMEMFQRSTQVNRGR